MFFKINFQKILFIVAVLSALVGFFCLNAHIIEAATTAELQALINQIEVQIAELQQQIAQIEEQPEVWCYDFDRNLKFGNSGSEVRALQTALEKEGFYKQIITGNFDKWTASAVVGFQEKYKEDILGYWGLEYGTGFVGSTTRDKLNQFYGCGVVSVPPIESGEFEEPVVPIEPEIGITILSPNGGEEWLKGKTYEITWSSNNVGKVSIWLVEESYKTSISDKLLAKVSASPRKYRWTISADIPYSDKYKIGVKNEDYLAKLLVDQSDGYFSIVEKEGTEKFDMLIFLSPQYKDDLKIGEAVKNYIKSVEEDINWNIEIIDISSENNDFRKIDEIIENYYSESEGNLKSCIMVGEDIHTALAGDISNCESPSTVPWSTLGGEDAYEIDYHFHPGPDTTQIAGKEGRMDIAVSLIYPTHQLDYQTKSSQIVSVFQKFSKDRDILYPKDIAVFISSEIAGISAREVYQTLNNYGNLYYKEDAARQKVIESLDKSYKMYNVSGHSTPEFTVIRPDASFYSDDINRLDAPLFTAHGCYTKGWHSSGIDTDNGILDFSIDRSWYGSKIFENPHLRVMALGMPSYWTASGSIISKRNFIINAMPGLGEGKTLAESIIKQEYENLNNIVIYGDPTFHYNTVIEGIKITLLSPNGEENWVKDNTYNVIWDSIGIEKINIEAFVNGDNLEYIVSGISSSSGRYSWKIPADFGVGFTLEDSVKIKISDAENISIFDESDRSFSIVENSYIEVFWPNGGEKLIPAEIYYIAWVSPGISWLKLDLYKEEEFYETITFFSEEVQKWAWIIPEGLKGEKYKIRVSNSDNLEIYDESDDFFSILETEPFIKVISPNGGEEWEIENTYEIIWNSDGVDIIDQILLWGPGFQFQKDELIAQNIPTSQEKYSWIIPLNIPSGDYKIRIWDSTGQLDDSDNYFSIIETKLGLESIENQLASISDAISYLIDRITE